MNLRYLSKIMAALVTKVDPETKSEVKEKSCQELVDDYRVEKRKKNAGRTSVLRMIGHTAGN